MIRETASAFILNIMLSCFPVFPLTAVAKDLNESSGRPRVALVLSGGGAKGFAHIGVLKVLEEEGIPVDIIVGTSMGGIVGGFYSIGYTAEELENIVKSMNWETVLSDEVPRSVLSKHDQFLKQRYLISLSIDGERKLSLPQGLIRGHNVLNIFCGMAGNVPVDADFSEFPVSFACLAVDLETGREIVLNKGFLPTALYSSMAIPVVFQPSSRDGILLLDGGIKNNFPTDVAKQMGADIIIGIDIRTDYYDREKLPTFRNVVGQIVNFSDMAKDSLKKSYCDLIIKPDMKGYNMSSFSMAAADTLIRRGMAAADKSREQLRELKVKYMLEAHTVSRDYIMPEKWHITGLQFSGDSYLDQHYMENILDLHIPGSYSHKEIKGAIDKLYGLGGFEHLYYSLLDDDDGKILNLNILTNKMFNLNVGFKTNTIDNSAILLNITSKNFSKTFGLFSADLELSVNPGLNLTTELNQKNLPTIGITLGGKRQKFNIFENTDKISETNLFLTRGGFYIYQPFLKNFTTGAGVMEEYYNLRNLNLYEDYPYLNGKNDFLLTNLYSFVSYDNMDDYYFPAKGTDFYAEISLLADFHKEDEAYFSFLLRNRNIIPVSRRTAVLLDLYSRLLFNQGMPQTKHTLIGGEPYSQYFNYHFPFVGLPVVNISGQYSYLGLAGVRFAVTPSHYISLLFNAIWNGADITPWKNDVTVGCGLKYSIETVLGPLDATLGYSFSSERPVFSASFGYWF